MSNQQQGANAERSHEAIRSWMVVELSKWAGVDPAQIDPGRPFTDYELDSLAAVDFAGQLETFVRFPVKPALFWDFPTVDLLAAELARQCQSFRVPTG